MKTRRDAPLARKRLGQAILLPLVGLAALAGGGLTVADGHALAVGAALAAGTVVLIAREFRQSRTAESLAYPLAGGTLGVVFATSLVRGLVSPGTAPASVEYAEHRPRRTPWSLGIILAVQAGLSLSLVWTNTAFGDEALYLWAGRIELAKWLHGTSLVAGAFTDGHALNFQAYFSGAPQIYPPLGALAVNVGGLAGARILSLGFMLTATVALYFMATKLFGKTPAIIACGLWAVSEPC